MNGLWTAEFGSSTGIFGGGVAVFKDGEILGGDATYFYFGHYSVKGNGFTATLISSPFIEGAKSVFNTVGHNLTLDLRGSLVGVDSAVAQGYWRENPNFRFGVRLTKRR